MKYNKTLITLSLIIVMILMQTEIFAQCPMCRLSAETNLAEGGTEGRGLNNGILYMLSLPYLLVATLGYIWWKNRRQFTEEIYEEPFSDN